MKEVWKVIEGFENYKVSNLGKVFSSNVGRVMNTHLNAHGYPTLNLSAEGAKTTVTVHRLVASAFIPNTDNLPEVNHINHDKTDNSVSNLEWVTRDANVQHGIAKTYIVTAPDGTKGVIKNLKTFCEANDLNVGNMCQVAKGTRQQHKGWKVKQFEDLLE